MRGGVGGVRVGKGRVGYGRGSLILVHNAN